MKTPIIFMICTPPRPARAVAWLLLPGGRGAAWAGRHADNALTSSDSTRVSGGLRLPREVVLLAALVAVNVAWRRVGRCNGGAR